MSTKPHHPRFHHPGRRVDATPRFGPTLPVARGLRRRQFRVLCRIPCVASQSANLVTEHAEPRLGLGDETSPGSDNAGQEQDEVGLGQDEVGLGQDEVGLNKTRSGSTKRGRGWARARTGRGRARTGRDRALDYGLDEPGPRRQGEAGPEPHKSRPDGLTLIIEPLASAELHPLYTVAPADEPPLRNGRELARARGRFAG